MKNQINLYFFYLCWFYDDKLKITYHIYLCTSIIYTLKYNYLINGNNYSLHNIKEYKLVPNCCILYMIDILNKNMFALSDNAYTNNFITLLNMALYNE